ncbi:hypothetical protein H8E77_27920, partial [bacterium]|nr:hypothetical protein [bacterium]
TSGKLFIADSNHNRIVVAAIEDGAILAVIGNGESGLADGNFAQASFNHPQGMAFDGENLYVADTDNHAIRQVNLPSQHVTTIAGTGEQAEFRSSGGSGKNAGLNSPWDLVLIEEKLYIAMAGAHQLWVISLKTEKVEPYAGSGQEARIDGRLEQAALAQPSGITTDGKKVYFADSEVSSIRAAELPPGNMVETIVGLDLFEFGDADGAGNQVRLQHPLGVAYQQGMLYITDTYNNKIKHIEPKTKTVQTVFGTGEAGLRDGSQPLFDEPGGLSIAHGRLYIADTNNHVIRIADLKTMQVSTLQFKEIEKLQTQVKPISPVTGAREIPPQTVKSGDIKLIVDLALPESYKINSQAPAKVILATEDTGKIRFQGEVENLTITQPEFPLQIPVQAQEGETRITVDMMIYYCQEGRESLCYFKEIQLAAPIKIQSDASQTNINVSYVLEVGSEGGNDSSGQ